jgi:hypothetical protein
VLVVPTDCEGNTRLAGDIVAAGAVMPFPQRPTVCGLFEVLSAKLRAALSSPTIDGLNVIITEHAASGAMDVAVHVFALMLKSAAFPPEIITASESKIKFALPVFVTVTDCGALDILIS